ncbi:hypothetical protein [Arthrobacter antibioticus]|uniref:hypothetical protein n=1 Tax=Arthrobacter sp. H35-MC1 TaxID=3046203 RepID=UPI0024B97562|nr:hypothetical protein [Arthrobacter sp. H35-MC1]
MRDASVPIAMVALDLALLGVSAPEVGALSAAAAAPDPAALGPGTAGGIWRRLVVLAMGWVCVAGGAATRGAAAGFGGMWTRLSLDIVSHHLTAVLVAAGSANQQHQEFL